ncbi:MAG TPA: methyltransferase [Flavipsychrobacter sp.]|nr:methyltransferase [Flavipsychrobacter sp.]
MSNSYFQFKQFRIEQGQCAMKVSTDACIQGAWTPIDTTVRHVLDIGAGTGLLSLMLAQRNNLIKIDAIELDKDAALQANENFAFSPWNDRLRCYQGDVKGFSFHRKYDLIISNPPFFSKSLLGDSVRRNQARHSLYFSLEHLVKVLDQQMEENGCASVLLPAAEHQIWENLLVKAGYSISGELHIIPAPQKPANRVVSICSRQQRVHKQTETLHIRTGKDHYSEDFKTLMQAFYLHL